MQVNRSTASCHAVYPACLKMFSGGPRGERGQVLYSPLQDKPTNLRPPPSLVAARPAVAPPLLSACVGLGMGTQTERSGNGRQGIVSCLCTHQISSHGRRPTESITNRQQRPLPYGTWTAVGTAGSQDRNRIALSV